MKIGKIISINFNELKVKISTEIRGNSVNIRGKIYYFGNVGGYLKTANSVNETIVCEVISIVDEDPNKERQSFNIESDRSLVLRPLGTIQKHSDDESNNQSFSLGIGIYPSLYSDIHILTHDDMEIMLATSTTTENPRPQEHQFFTLGLSKSLINYPVLVNINSFFQIHSAVLGNSGSGKSNTIAHIIQQILRKKQHAACGAKIILFDVNGEYKKAFDKPDNADTTISSELNIQCYRPNISNNENGNDGYEAFTLPHFLLSIDEWCAFLLATDATQRPFWSNVLQESYRFYALADNQQNPLANTGPTQDDFIHYFVDHVCLMMTNVIGKVESDTVIITSAISLIGRVKDLIILDEDLQTASEKCVFGNNKKNISSMLQKFMDSTSIKYGANEEKLRNAIDEYQNLADDSKVNNVKNAKLIIGERYSYKFLKIATELCLADADSRGSKNIRNWVSTMLTRLEYFLENPDCEFMRDGIDNHQTTKGIKDIESYLESMFSIGGNGDEHQLTIIDTSSLPPDALETLTSVVARLIFDYRRSAGPKRIENPVHLILDEAHRYVKKKNEYRLKDNIFEKIAREGRKYSYFLLISSQRPSELSETVLSQCGNYIIHRIQNEIDMNYVKGIMPFFSPDMVGRIKQAVPGDAMVFGNCVPIPLHVAIEKAKPMPSSENCDITHEWFGKKSPKNDNDVQGPGLP